MAALSSRISDYSITHQGIRDLDQPRQASRNDSMRINVGEEERALSAVGGAGLAALGAARGGCLGLTLVWAGAALLLRGVTGHCALKEVLGRS